MGLRGWTGAATAVWLAAVLAGAAPGPAAAAAEPAGDGWDRAGAARYLDGREVWWQAWDRTAKDRRTLCVSCHTQATYALVRPRLRQQLGEAGPGPAEQAMLASIVKRVKTWPQMQPFYSDVISGPGKEVESRDAEAVLNAFILSGYDARSGRLEDTTRLAFDNAWALQSKTGPDAGAWVWQNFGYGPWESKESQYHWAALMAVAVAAAPQNYRDDPKIAASLGLLKTYLAGHYAAQPLINRMAALWAAAGFPEIVAAPERGRLVAEILSRQHGDGGWSLTDLGPWARRDGTPLETRSDGYATGLAVLVLQKAGAGTSPGAMRGLSWLRAGQDPATGAWTAWSVNKNRDPKSDAGLFMTDAATAYAVLALEGSK